MATVFPLMSNIHVRTNMKKMVEVIEDFTTITAKEAEDLKEQRTKAARNEMMPAASSLTILPLAINGEKEKDVLSIFFSAEVKELGQRRDTNFEFTDAAFQTDRADEAISKEDDSMTAPAFSPWEGITCPDIDEHMHPDAEMEFLSTFGVQAPLSSYLNKTELPQDLQMSSKWNGQYLTSVGKILLAKVKEIETGLSHQAMKERDKEDSSHLGPTDSSMSSSMRESNINKKMLSQSATKKIRFSHTKIINDPISKQTLKEREMADLEIAGFFKDQVAEEEEPDDDINKFVSRRTIQPLEFPLLEDSPFSTPKAESPEEMEAFGKLLQQIEMGLAPLRKIKLQYNLSPQYIVQKTAQIIQKNNLIRLENTALEITLNKLHVGLNFEHLQIDNLQPMWGQILSNQLFQMRIYEEENVSTSLKEMSKSMDVGSSDTKQTPSQSMISSVPDTDTTDSVSGYELGRYTYMPPKEVISFEPLASNHAFGVKPPYYRFMPIEEAVKKADEKRDLSKRVHQTKKEIIKAFLKEPESDSGSDDGEESGWRKWLSYERRQDLVNNATGSLISLNEALHMQALRTLRELEARKINLQQELSEKSAYTKELLTMSKMKREPHKWSHVLFKTMKSYLAMDLKTKNNMLAQQRTLFNKIAEMTKTVRHIKQLEKKTDWGDLALQRLQYNSVHRRNITTDEDINQLKKLNAVYTLRLIHAREELDAKVRENKNLVKHRDLSMKKKNIHKEAYMIQHKKLGNVQECLKEAPKISDIERFVNQARTEEYKKMKMKQYHTELEVREALKKIDYLKSRIDGLGMEYQSIKHLKESHMKIVRTKKLLATLEKYCKEAEKNEFGVIVEKLEPPCIV